MCASAVTVGGGSPGKRKERKNKVRTPNQPPAPLEAAGAAKRMGEGGRGREVGLERFALGGGRGLREEVDDLGDLGFCGGRRGGRV